MTRKVFYSFHYEPDSQRVSQVRNMGKVEGNSLASDNEWESITDAGDSEIEKWIADQMYGRSCVVVLVGSQTAGRKWVKYEIQKAWDDGRGLVGIHIHGLKNLAGETSHKGLNPFGSFSVDGANLSSIVKCHNPGFSTSTDNYDHIKNNIQDWIEEAIEIRKGYA